MISAVLALVGTLIGSLGGILATNRLVMWRLEQLEKKVDKHNGLMEWKVEAAKDISTLCKRVDDLENAE